MYFLNSKYYQIVLLTGLTSSAPACSPNRTKTSTPAPQDTTTETTNVAKLRPSPTDKSLDPPTKRRRGGFGRGKKDNQENIHKVLYNYKKFNHFKSKNLKNIKETIHLDDKN